MQRNWIPFQDYPTFLRFIRDAEFVVTDGGSVQEESYYLGKPCLIMRKRTERSEGIGENAILGRSDKNVIDEFARSYKRYVRQELKQATSPSDLIVNEILKYA